MAALYRNKLLTVHSEILAGMRIVVWGWSVALTAMKKIFYTPCNKFCFVLWPHTSNFSLPLKYSTKEKTSTSLHLIQGQATWIDWLTYRCVCGGEGIGWRHGPLSQCGKLWKALSSSELHIGLEEAYTETPSQPNVSLFQTLLPSLSFSRRWSQKQSNKPLWADLHSVSASWENQSATPTPRLIRTVMLCEMEPSS